MLSLIRITDYAIIDEVELELEPGFSVMTGETGAGKSILVDALGLALGDRADAAAVRQGAKRAEISIVFECPTGHPSAQWLSERGLDQDETCCLRRLISAEGRSRAFINNQPVTLPDLRALGALLVDIHGQHAHQSLLSAATQRHMLDHHAGLEALAASVARAYRDWRAAERELAERSERGAERESQLDLLRFQHAELTELGLAENEVEELKGERGRLGNADKLLQGLGTALEQLYEGELGAAYSQVAHARQSIDALTEHDETLAELGERLTRTEIEVKEIAADLARYRDRLEPDPARLELVESRLDRIAKLARRHRVDETELAGVVTDLEAQIEGLDSSMASLEALTEQAARARKHYYELARQLSAKRREQAESLGAQVSSRLRELGMPHGEFEADIEPRPDDQADATGIDRIEFRVRVNPGQPFGALSRVASGGELSRISLALEVVAADSSPVTTFVFDEVDAGIGGGVAEIVGRRLRQVAEHRQVLCVTHLPQVASQGAEHYRILKLTDGKTSRTQVRRLKGDERVEELSRMLGGVEITAATRAHAEEMIREARGA